MSSTARARRSRRDERKEETRAELIAAASHAFARKGFHGASLEEIARDAGYTTGAVYWHFKYKDDLFLAVYEEYTTTRVREWEAVKRDVEAGALPGGRAWADQWMERVRDDPEFLVLSIEFLVHAWRNPPLREAFADRVAAGRLALGRLIEAGAESGGYQLPMPAEDLATVLRELGSGLGLAKLIDPDGIPDSLFGDFTDLFIRLVRESQPRGAGQRGRRTRARR
jgi:AcrR family transcriptional regulator